MKYQTLILAGLLCVSTQAHAQNKDVQVKTKINHTEQVDKIELENKLFTQLIRGTTEDYGKTPQPYFYPIIGPTGANMTRQFPMKQGVEGESRDHPHHRSLWFTHGNVNGVDFWHGKGTIKSTEIDFKLNKKGNKPYVTYARTDTWLDGKGDAMLTNLAEFAPGKLEDGSLVLDLFHDLKPAQGIEQVVFGDTKEGSMAIRTHPALRLKGEVATGKAINSEGHKDKAVWGKRAKWVAYWGQIDGKTCGFAIFDHPTNLRHPTWWHARDYGLVAANPFGISDFEKGKHKKGAGNHTIKQGEALKLRYRFVFFAGTAEEADIAGKYDQWVKDTTK